MPANLTKELKHAAVAGFAETVFILAIAVALSAQGVPASVTSHGFGGQSNRTGPPASVTSHGWNNQFTQSRPAPPVNKPHHHYNNGLAWGVPVYYPYAPGYMTDPDSDPPADANDQQGGPTIFDRNGGGPIPRPAMNYYPSPRNSANAANAQADAAPAEDQPQTLLVFKDGHEDQVQNYAVVGNTLYDLSPGRHRKIALADLDLKATAQQNDDMGISFQLPASADTP